MPLTSVQNGYESAKEYLQNWGNADVTRLIEKVDQFKALALTQEDGGLSLGISKYLWDCVLAKAWC